MNEIQLLGRFFSRWIMIYFLCFTFTLPIEIISLPLQAVPEKHQPVWLKEANTRIMEFIDWFSKHQNKIITKVGEKVFDTKVIIQPTGSGDTRRNYVGVFCALVLSLGISIVVSTLLEWLRWRKSHWNLDGKLHTFSRIWVRFFLIEMLFGYGFAKLYPNQFPVPSYLYERPFGDLQPMDLLWSFMGHSTPYQMITGSVEVLAALLLVPRRTATLGALMTIMAMTQVFILNMCYDVPVKLHSFHYLLMGLFLAAPALPQLFKLLVLGQPGERLYQGPLFQKLSWNVLAYVVKALMVGLMLYVHIDSGYERYQQQHKNPANLIQGTWEVTEITINSKPPENGDKDHWKKIDFNTAGAVVIYGQAPPAWAYMATFDQDKKQIQLQQRQKPLWRGSLHYDQPAEEELKIIGKLNSKEIVATLKKLPQKVYKLPTQGFHWIHEFPRDDGK